MTSVPPEYSINFMEPERNKNPFPELNALREMAPVVYNPAIKTYMATTYSAARTVLRDEARFSQDVEFGRRFLGGETLTSTSKPFHTRIRAVLGPQLTRGSIDDASGWMTRTVHELVDPVIDRMLDGETVDPVTAAIHYIPAAVITEMLGLEPEGRERFRAWMPAIIGLADVDGQADPEIAAELLRNGLAAQEEVKEYCGRLLRERRRNPGNDLISTLATSTLGEADQQGAGDDPDAVTHFTEADFVAQISQLILAAQDNTAHLMSNMLILLARHPDQRRAIEHDRELLPQAMEEANRHTGSIMFLPRLVRHGDVELEGYHIPNGARVWSLHGSADRDPSRWERPDDFDIFREYKTNIGFGFGAHNCIGVSLARKEVSLFLNRFLDRAPEWQLATEDFSFGSTFISRGPEAVPLYHDKRR
ncbi:cytochrome P450 [Pseudonocardia kujensis]|uniref:cytochrome P450 n=1 Tax=Pseudonocardia kujensis TaxID=1128675 RepID=UPI001E388A6C|nr:cytochrome P450 [Pseudonocardia kujensis]MCE0765069.1 cytochrome P450 [Pseudonocardia kujensis]